MTNNKIETVLEVNGKCGRRSPYLPELQRNYHRYGVKIEL